MPAIYGVSVLPALPATITYGLYAGMTTATLSANLAQAQAAYNLLNCGAKVATASYAQGDGSRSVTYGTSSLPGLMAYIQSLQVALGIVVQARRPMRPYYR